MKTLPLKKITYAQNFKLKGGKNILHLVYLKDARKVDGETKVQIEGDIVPAFWVNWDTEVELVENVPNVAHETI